MRKRTEPPPDFAPPSGLCECGCGGATPICTNSSPRYGKYFGFPLRFIHGHHRRGVASPKPKGSASWKWKGGRVVDVHGYVLVYKPGHEMANSWGYVLEHRLVWSSTYGAIPPRHHVHHIDGDRQNNALSNLVCISPSEHAQHHGGQQSAERRAKIAASVKRAHARRKAQHG